MNVQSKKIKNILITFYFKKNMIIKSKNNKYLLIINLLKIFQNESYFYVQQNTQSNPSTLF